MTNERPTQPQLKHGSEFPSHEDCIVGDEAGLRNLRNACDLALQEGAHYNSQLGDYIGVEKLESDWFEQQPERPAIGMRGLALLIFLLVVSALAFVGLATTIKWLF